MASVPSEIAPVVGAHDLPTTGLVVQTPWIDYLLNGTKTWELRSTRTSLRGRFGLIRKGSGCVSGEAELVDVLGPFDDASLAAACAKHCVPPERMAFVIQRGYRYAWVVRNAKQYERPVPYLHRSGAVTWVRLR